MGTSTSNGSTTASHLLSYNRPGADEGWGPGWGIRRSGIAGPGWGPWGWNGGMGTNVAYIPSASSWVKFINGKVESWQRGRPE